jgi:hypothetical protein
MTFDINEARAIIEDAKKRGLIRTGNAGAATKPKAPLEHAAKTIIPDWLQESIDEGPVKLVADLNSSGS